MRESEWQQKKLDFSLQQNVIEKMCLRSGRSLVVNGTMKIVATTTGAVGDMEVDFWISCFQNEVVRIVIICYPNFFVRKSLCHFLSAWPRCEYTRLQERLKCGWKDCFSRRGDVIDDVRRHFGGSLFVNLWTLIIIIIEGWLFWIQYFSKKNHRKWVENAVEIHNTSWILVSTILLKPDVSGVREKTKKES